MEKGVSRKRERDQRRSAGSRTPLRRSLPTRPTPFPASSSSSSPGALGWSAAHRDTRAAATGYLRRATVAVARPGSSTRRGETRLGRLAKFRERPISRRSYLAISARDQRRRDNAITTAPRANESHGRRVVYARKVHVKPVQEVHNRSVNLAVKVDVGPVHISLLRLLRLYVLPIDRCRCAR